jgi:hypothetical protein
MDKALARGFQRRKMLDVRMQGVEVRLRPNGLAGMVREVADSRRAAA